MKLLHFRPLRMVQIVSFYFENPKFNFFFKKGSLPFHVIKSDVGFKNSLAPQCCSLHAVFECLIVKSWFLMLRDL